MLGSHQLPHRLEQAVKVCAMQRCMLSAAHLRLLEEETGVRPWTFEQHELEAVVIPAGCPHQVRLQARKVGPGLGACTGDCRSRRHNL